MAEVGYRRKLIEVDLPLSTINAESSREKSIRHGHPSTLHLWWARRPLAACRAVIFASLVDDPSSCAEEFATEEAQQAERERLHDLIRRLVVWENSSEEALINEARYEIARSVARSRGQDAPTEPAAVLEYLRDEALPIYDPFAGGGSIPLEAQRLGLRAIASDLNPVAVLINKALIELPPKFADQPPVNPEADPLGMMVGKGKRAQRAPWRGAAGLADDIRYYGRWMRERAFEQIGHLYPKATLPDGSEATVIVWLWARTIPCPNSACGIQMPLLSTFALSRKRGNEHWIKPEVSHDSDDISYTVQSHDRGVPTKGTINRNGASCIACGTTAPLEYVRAQARSGAMDEQMTAIVAEGDRRRIFLSPAESHIQTAHRAAPSWRPAGELPEQALGFRVQRYGVTSWHELFSERQLIALTTLSDLLSEVRRQLTADGASTVYADTICTYLALAIGRTANSSSKFNIWQNLGDKVAQVFVRQAISMIWDFAETNIFSNSTQNWLAQIEWIAKAVEHLPYYPNPGEAYQADATTTIHVQTGPVIVTDPPYYDNIGYADLSDFFYVWLRPLLRSTYPDLFAGIVTPKQEEMIATEFRFEDPRQHFEDRLGDTLRLIREHCSPEFPSSIFYAYKQQEQQHDGRTSTGWDTMLSALVSAGFQIIGTWPMRTERANRPRSLDSNALASSVVLVCRSRPANAPTASRREFLDALQEELPNALDHLTRDNHIAPVDLAQAAIGPGMEIYSRYSGVETIRGEPVTVREALAEINRVIAEYDERQQGELDAETRFCLDWLEQHGYGEGDFGEAEVLSQAKNVSVDGLASDGLLRSRAGKVRLLGMEEYDHARLRLGMSAWEGCLRIGWHMGSGEGQGGVGAAAEVARAMGGDAESVERLARILYNHYDRRNDSRNAVMFNSVVTEWPAIMRAVDEPEQGQMLGER